MEPKEVIEASEKLKVKYQEHGKNVEEGMPPQENLKVAEQIYELESLPLKNSSKDE